MNKKERIEFIDNESEELAKSGKYSDWMFIEAVLRGDGYSEARQVLDDQFKRRYLNKLCKIAQSDSEVQLREEFEKWKDKVVEECQLVVTFDNDRVRITSYDDFLLISTSKFEAKIVRMFNSNVVTVAEVRLIDKSIVIKKYNLGGSLTVNKVDCDEIAELVNKLQNQAINH